MADLKCVVENCTYNKDCLCSKGDIMVGGKHACDCDGTCCESFAQKREGRESFSNSLSHPSHTISIDGKENQYSGLTNVPKLRIIEQVIGFGGRPPVHRIQ